MIPKRSEAERQAAFLVIETLKASPQFQTYRKEILRIHNAIACGAYKESGEQLAKTAGILHGLDLALNIEQFLQPKKGI
jgi:hypothetical protein